MSLTIWKYDLLGATHPPHGDRAAISMPKGAVVLTVQVQNGRPVIWAIADPRAPQEPREFVIVGTGHEMPESWRYVGTWQQPDSWFVGHLFEVVSDA